MPSISNRMKLWHCTDLASLFAGTVGVFLGWSTLFILSLAKKLANNENFEKCFDYLNNLLWLIFFIIWSYGPILKYWQEDQSMELEILRNISPPFVTYCPTDKFYLRKQFPCAISSNYIENLQNCLGESNDIIEYIEKFDLEEFDTPEPISSSNISRKALSKEEWSKIYHPKFGACYTLNNKMWSK